MPHTIAENLTRLTTARTNIANAITAKGGTVTSGDGFEEFPADIATIPSGGESANRNDVNFYDYDGTIVDSYSASDFAALSALPDNPTHEGLTAQGWNWSLADAKAYVAKYGKLNIGQMYITADGKTRLYISLTEGRLSPVLGLGVNGSVDVDWGDGTTHGTLTGTSTATLVTIPHTYTQGGDYVITLTAAEGTTMAVQGANWESLLLTKDGTGGNQSRVYYSALKKHTLGDSVTIIGNYAFQNCYSLTNITIPDSITGIGESAFGNCYSLTNITIPDSVTSIGRYVFQYCCALINVTIPDSVTSIGNSAFQYCYSLASITIPDSVTSIGNGAFQSCFALTSVTIPDSVTSIGSSAFQYCYGLGFIRFESTTPPTVSNANAFSGIPTDCIIYVPAGYLENYEDATNYPDPDVYTYVEY